jgi:hypothetical protein
VSRVLLQRVLQFDHRGPHLAVLEMPLGLGKILVGRIGQQSLGHQKHHRAADEPGGTLKPATNPHPEFSLG